jgi:hypothetical protein
VLPTDAARPLPAITKDASIADWGRVTRHEIVEAMTESGHPTPMSLFEVVGQRGTYQFDGDVREMPQGFSLRFPGWLDAKVGDLIVICPLGEFTRYQPPAPWRRNLTAWDALVPVSAPPRTTELARLAPRLVEANLLPSHDGKLQLAPAHRYLVYDTIVDGEAPRWVVGKRWGSWWLEVPSQAPGAALVGIGKGLWFVVEAPSVEAIADAKSAPGPWASSETERAVWRAAAVLDDVFPQ